MTVKLVVEKSEGQPGRHAFSITTEETVVGRHRECGLRIPCAEVSRRHCILRLLDGVLTIEDLGSLNGIYVNGERVQGCRSIAGGDRIEIGPVLFSAVYENVAVAVGVPAEVCADSAVSESATVDLKPADTHVIDGGAQVVAIERLPDAPAAAIANALTRLER